LHDSTSFDNTCTVVNIFSSSLSTSFLPSIILDLISISLSKDKIFDVSLSFSCDKE
jgi:hypothetical protein